LDEQRATIVSWFSPPNGWINLNQEDFQDRRSRITIIFSISSKKPGLPDSVYFV
jgi:hypothetical protein